MWARRCVVCREYADVKYGDGWYCLTHYDEVRDVARPTEGDDEPECPFCGRKGRHVCHN